MKDRLWHKQIPVQEEVALSQDSPNEEETKLANETSIHTDEET